MQCLTCGADVPSDPNPKRTRKFCSRACSSIAQRKQIAVPCLRCGKTMMRAPWHAERGGSQYCSRACQHPAAHITCDWCGKQKRVSPSGIGERNFCSRKCGRAWQGAQGIVGVPYARVDVTCDSCGVVFQRQQYAVKSRNYCSKVCFYHAHIDNMGGDKNPAWRGGFDPYYGPNWKQQARRARQRDSHTCQHCGAIEADLHCAMHVHHIIPLRDFQRDFRRANALSNLVSLCPACHKLLEWHPDQMRAFVEAWSATRQSVH